MPIAPLAESATRVLVSSLVLHDATSVVKELVENALDARATNILVEIHANTLDIIQVKDNGRGIGVEDRQLICKRGCTSKIRTFEDLTHLGGTSLGFRGEALASLAELSSLVTITTRVEGEVVGTSLSFEASGKLRSSSSASHPVGTTVRVQDLLKNIPVRRQTVLKSSAKVLNNIKRLLQTYALARPEIRLSFKVIKGKENANCTYAPSTGPDAIHDAARKVLGKEIVDQCGLKAASFGIEDEGNNTGYNLQALLLLPEQDPCKFGGGQYISIDRRPVTSERGTMKELAKLYKSYLKRGSRQQALSIPANAFLCMHITCPPDSYDVNVEPAKDEVMFEDPEPLLDLAERLFQDIYGGLSSEKGEETTISKQQKKGLGDTGFDLLLARKRTNLQPNSTPEDVDNTSADAAVQQGRSPYGQPSLSIPADDADGDLKVMESPEREPFSRSRHHVNMASFDEDEILEDAIPLSNTEEMNDDAEAGGRDVSLNPWTIIKMNAVIPPVKSGFSFTTTSATSEDMPVTLASGDLSLPSPGRSPQQLPTPGVSPQASTPYQNPGPPLRRRQYRVQEDSDDEESDSQPMATASRPNMLNGWVRRSQAVEPSQPGSPTGTQTSEVEGEDSNSQSMLDAALRYSRENPPGSAPSLSTMVQRPFRSPVKRTAGSSRQAYTHTGRLDYVPKPTKVASLLPPDNETPEVVSDSTPGGLPVEPFSPPLDPSSRQPLNQNPELIQILDFERRKREAIAQQRKALLETARLQQKSSRSEFSSAAALEQEAHPTSPSQADSSASSSRDYTTQFSTPQATPEDISRTSRSNPHRNRYLAALRGLDHQASPKDPSRQDSSSQEQPSPNTHPTTTHPTTQRPQIATSTHSKHSSDPRLAFISQQRSALNDATHGLTRSLLKPRRQKCLPLESIPSECATWTLVGVHPSLPLEEIGTACKTLSGVDEYVLSGRVNAMCFGASLVGGGIGDEDRGSHGSVDGDLDGEVVAGWVQRIRELTEPAELDGVRAADLE